MPYSKLELKSIRTGIGQELIKLDNVIEKAESELRDANHRKRNLISRLEKMDEAEQEQGRKEFWEHEMSDKTCDNCKHRDGYCGDRNTKDDEWRDCWSWQPINAAEPKTCGNCNVSAGDECGHSGEKCMEWQPIPVATTDAPEPTGMQVNGRSEVRSCVVL